ASRHPSLSVETRWRGPPRVPTVVGDMRNLPLADPGVPDSRSPGRYLWWVMRGQQATLLGGMTFGTIWMVAQAIMPALIGKAIDQGVANGDTSRLLFWAGMLLLAGVVQAAAGIIRHRFAVMNWLMGAYRTVQVITRHSVKLGATLSKRVATGEVVAIGTADLAQIGNALDVYGRAAGALISFTLVSVILLRASVTLGLVVLIGVPVLLLAITPILRPLQRRSMTQREQMGELTTLASDIVGGLRVLRGIGGEDVFHDRYARDSQRVRMAGVRVAKIQSLLDALQVLLPGLFVVVVVWLGARFAVQGTISVGELVAFYGYAAFLMMPLRTATEFAQKQIRALVACRRIVKVLSVEPEIVDPQDPQDEPGVGDLVDHGSGVTIRPGILTAIVSEPPEEAAAVADRLGRFTDGNVTLAGVALAELPKDTVRRRILVSDTGSMLFSGRLFEELDLRDSGNEPRIDSALRTTSSEDITEALPEGLDADVEERGRSFSGGQRQRLVLTRALMADAEILVLVDPTSAVDAHTEARIAERLTDHRRGRTTVVTTTSPLLLDRADHVTFLLDGNVVAQGTHKTLLETEPRYRWVVTREEDQ
ncbi:MAG: ABC transporter ATP-binding protein, partial [Nocardioidaceae bacterium]